MKKERSDIEKLGEYKLKNFDKKRKIFLTNGQIEYGRVVFDKDTKQKVWKPYEYVNHRNDVQSINEYKDGQPLLYVHIKIPSMRFREICHGENAYSFGEQDGFDLDKRQGYIQIPLPCLVNYTQSVLMDLPQLNDGMSWFVNNPNAVFTVYFKAKRIKTLANGKGQFENLPKPKITTQDLYRIFPTSKQQIRKLQKSTKRVVTRVVDKDKLSEKAKENEPKPETKKIERKKKTNGREL